MNIIEQIKAEIERLKKDNEISEDKDYAQYELDCSCGYDEALNDMLSFLSTLESEKPMQEGLEEEMDRFFETMPVLEHENIFDVTFQNIARHFAQWGAEHLADARKTSPKDLEEAAKEYAREYTDSDNGNGGDDWEDDIRITFKA